MSTTITILYIFLFSILFISLQTQKQNHFGSKLFLSSFILLKVLGLDNATRFFLPLLSLWFLWSSRNIRCDSQFSWLALLKYYCPLYFFAVWVKIKCSIIYLYISFYSDILSPAASSVDEQVLLKLAIKELGLVPAGPDPSKLTIL